MTIKLGNFRLGLRTLKTGLAVLIILLLATLTGRGNNAAMIAGISAVIAIRDNFTNTFHAARSRIAGSTLGGCFSFLYYLGYTASHHAFWVQALLLPLFVIANIVIMDGLTLHPGLVGANATLLIISLTIPDTQVYAYILDRVIDTFIGVVVAILVNSFLVADGPFSRQAKIKRREAK